MNAKKAETGPLPGSDSQLAKEGAKLSVLTMASRILGLVRERTRGGLMGTGMLADAFTVAFNVPNLFRRLFAEGSMSAAFIPTVKLYLSEKEKEETEDFLSATFTALSVTVAFVCAVGIAASPLLTGLFRSEPQETALLMRIMFPFLALVSLAAFFQGILNSFGIFSPSGFAPILFNLSFIFVPVFIAPLCANPARAMAIGVLAGGLLQALCQLPWLVRLGLRFRFVSPLKAFANPGMRRVMALIAPTILGMAAYELNGLVSTSLATLSGVGAATALSFSIRLQELVLGVFVVSVGTVMLPELSGIAGKKDWLLYKERLGIALEVIVLITIPLTVLSILERNNIVILVYKTREFGDASVKLTAGAFLFHMTGLPFIGLNRILAPAFYSRSDAKTPAWAGIAAVIVNIILAIAMQSSMGAKGIALALSLASAFNCAILLWRLVRAGIDGMAHKVLSILLYMLKLLLFSCIAALPVMLIQARLSMFAASVSSKLLGHGLAFFVSSLIYAIIEIGLLFISKDPAGAWLLRSFAKKRSRQSV